MGGRSHRPPIKAVHADEAAMAAWLDERTTALSREAVATGESGAACLSSSLDGPQFPQEERTALVTATRIRIVSPGVVARAMASLGAEAGAATVASASFLQPRRVSRRISDCIHHETCAAPIPEVVARLSTPRPAPVADVATSDESSSGTGPRLPSAAPDGTFIPDRDETRRRRRGRSRRVASCLCELGAASL